MVKPTAGGKNIARKHPDAKGKEKSPVQMVIKPTENGLYYYPLALSAWFWTCFEVVYIVSDQEDEAERAQWRQITGDLLKKYGLPTDIICSTEMCKKPIPITIWKHSLNVMEALHATKILKMLYFHNIFQYKVHTEICISLTVTTLA